MDQSLFDTRDNLPRTPDVAVEEAFDYASATCKNQTPVIAAAFPNNLPPQPR